MKEGQFNSVLVKSIKSEGVFAQKMADRFKPGVLDIYLTGGIWIESKVIHLGGQNRLVSILGKMSAPQRTFADTMISGGDKVVIAVRIELPYNENRLMMIPYFRLFDSPEWYNRELAEFPRILKESKYDVHTYFGSQYEGHLNLKWYEEGSRR